MSTAGWSWCGILSSRWEARGSEAQELLQGHESLSLVLLQQGNSPHHLAGVGGTSSDLLYYVWLSVRKNKWDQVFCIVASQILKQMFGILNSWKGLIFFFAFYAYLGLFQNLSSRRKKTHPSSDFYPHYFHIQFFLCNQWSLSSSAPFSAAVIYRPQIAVKNSLCFCRVIILAFLRFLQYERSCISCNILFVLCCPSCSWSISNQYYSEVPMVCLLRVRLWLPSSWKCPSLEMSALLLLIILFVFLWLIRLSLCYVSFWMAQ